MPTPSMRAATHSWRRSWALVPSQQQGSSGGSGAGAVNNCTTGQQGHGSQLTRAMSGPPSGTRSIANTEALHWVDMGLRYLTELLEDQARHGPAAVPSITIAHVGRCGLEVSVSPPVNSPLGWFSPLSDGTGLVLDPELSMEDLEALAGDHWPAWPALVSVGESDGCEVLLNLEHAGSVSVEGPATLVDATLVRFALEFACQPWSDEMLSGLYLFGDCPLSPDRAHGQQVPSGDAMKLAEKLSRVSGAHQQLVGGLSLSALRAIACEALPNVAVAFSGTPGQALHGLADAAVPESSGVALVGAGPYPGARWTMTLSPDGECRVGGQVRGRSVSLSLRTGTRTEEPFLLAKAFQEAVQASEPYEDTDAGVSGGTPGSENLASAPDGSEMARELEGGRYEQDPLEHRLQPDGPLQEGQREWQQRHVVADVHEGYCHARTTAT